MVSLFLVHNVTFFPLSRTGVESFYHGDICSLTVFSVSYVAPIVRTASFRYLIL